MAQATLSLDDQIRQLYQKLEVMDKDPRLLGGDLTFRDEYSAAKGQLYYLEQQKHEQDAKNRENGTVDLGGVSVPTTSIGGVGRDAPANNTQTPGGYATATTANGQSKPTKPEFKDLTDSERGLVAAAIMLEQAGNESFLHPRHVSNLTKAAVRASGLPEFMHIKDDPELLEKIKPQLEQELKHASAFLSAEQVKLLNDKILGSMGLEMDPTHTSERGSLPDDYAKNLKRTNQGAISRSVMYTKGAGLSVLADVKEVAHLPGDMLKFGAAAAHDGWDALNKGRASKTESKMDKVLAGYGLDQDAIKALHIEQSKDKDPSHVGQALDAMNARYAENKAKGDIKGNYRH